MNPETFENCPICEGPVNKTITNFDATSPIYGRVFVKDVTLFKCQSCGEGFHSRESNRRINDEVNRLKELKKVETKKIYTGYTYPSFLDNKFIHKLWKKFYCHKGIHLFDEVGGNRRYLYCDACDLEVELK